MQSKHLPQIDSRKTQRNSSYSRHSVPFSKVKREMGDLSYSSNTESSEMWARNRSQEPYVPLGMKAYDLVSMTEITMNNKHREDGYKQKYMKVFVSNPSAFHRNSGDFTKYIDCAIKAEKKGPFIKKK